MRWLTAPICAALGVAGCGATLVPVVPDGPHGAEHTPADPTFDVVALTAGAKDPLPVSGAHVEYGDLSAALGQAIVHSVHPRHAHTLTAEIVSAKAEASSGQLAVSFVVRATLRAHQGNAFVAQTQSICRQSARVPPERGGDVVWACMSELGRDLRGWLDGLPP